MKHLKLIKKIFQYKLKYLIKNNFVSKDYTSDIKIGKNVFLRNVHIAARNNSTIIIGDNVEIDSVNINVDNGYVEIFNNNIICKGNSAIKPSIIIQTGKFILKENNTFKAKVWVRFGGILEVGKFNAINENSELRCDEKLQIGDFNMISYDCMIYDTNTHCIYEPLKRRKLTIEDFPIMGREIEKPITKPVIIGNDCWIGKRATILKGTILYNEVIIGSNAVVSNKTIDNYRIAYGNPCIIRNQTKNEN